MFSFISHVSYGTYYHYIQAEPNPSFATTCCLLLRTLHAQTPSSHDGGLSDKGFTPSP